MPARDQLTQWLFGKPSLSKSQRSELDIGIFEQHTRETYQWLLDRDCPGAGEKNGSQGNRFGALVEVLYKTIKQDFGGSAENAPTHSLGLPAH